LEPDLITVDEISSPIHINKKMLFTGLSAPFTKLPYVLYASSGATQSSMIASANRILLEHNSRALEESLPAKL
jgi:hypothetical protein